MSAIRLADAARITDAKDAERAQLARPERRDLSPTVVLARESAITLLQRAYGLVCIYTEAADGGMVLANTELRVTDDHVAVLALGATPT